jgi:hypothetical protein
MFSAIGGNFATVYGTSASSPVFASMISFINDARLAQGKNSVGFINPTVNVHSRLKIINLNGTDVRTLAL